jgi:hypothetical protein
VSLNGRIIATLNAAALGGGRHAVAIPPGLARRRLDIIELMPAKP